MNSSSSSGFKVNICLENVNENIKNIRKHQNKKNKNIENIFIKAKKDQFINIRSGENVGGKNGEWSEHTV